MKIIRTSLLIAAILTANHFSKIAATPLSTASDMSVLLQAVEATTPLAASNAPLLGNFYSAQHAPGSASPWPPLPGNISDSPVWSLGDGIYLLDDLSVSYSPQTKSLTGGMHTMDDAGPPLPGGGGEGTNEGGSFPTYTFPTNGLWLQVTNIANGQVYLNLMNATDSVYEILSKTDLTLTHWTIEPGEVWPTNTNAMPFTVNQAGRTNLFLWAADWTGVTENGNTTPDWWLYYYYGIGGLSLSDATLDFSGNSLLYDYENGMAPTTFTFTEIETTNNCFNTALVPAQLAVTGSPYYIAVSVDDTNFADDAVWQNYCSSNITVDLGVSEGWHDVWVGLRGRGETATNGVWQWKRLKLDLTPPRLVVTNPVMVADSATTSVPLVQIKGYSPEQLDTISYDLSNAAVVLTNQNAGITDQFYDTNTWELTTNDFECVDVPLTNGLNLITLHATDEAGNETTTNIAITLDGSSRTNPPVVQLYWPQDGTLVCNSNFTWRGWVDDPTAVVSAQMVDTNGNTNTFNGIVERDGHFWIENLPMNGGTNEWTLSVTDWLGNVATTNITVYPGAVALTIDPTPADQLWNQTLTVTGTIGDPDDYTVWVNGVKATNNEEGTWEADNVPNTPGGTSLIQARAIPDSDNGGNGTGGGDGTSARYDNLGNPYPPQDNDAESQTDKPARVYMKSYDLSLNEHDDGSSTTYGAEGNVTGSSQGSWDIGSSLDWDHQSGGDGSDSDRQEWSGTGGDHTVVDDEDTSDFPADGAGTIIYNVTAIDYDNPDENDFETETSADWPDLMSEHCQLNGRLNANLSWFDSSGGYQANQNVSFNRHAQTTYELQTGGKGKAGQQSLFILSAGAQSGALLLQPDWNEAYPWSYVPDVPVDPTQIQMMSQNEDAAGNVYGLLADNQTVDVTPQAKGKDYYTWGGPGQAEYTLKHATEHSALTNTNRNRTTIGVGEAVDLSGMPANTTWSVSVGGLSATNGSGTTFTAPNNASSATVTASVGGQSLQVTFSVLAPSGIDHAVIINNYSNSYPVGLAGAGMDINVFVAPTSVSFYRVCIMEIPGPASNITGYFTTNTPPNHGAAQGAGEWSDPLSDDNHFGDTAASAALSPPWVAGGFDWVIPSKWQVQGTSVTNSFTQWTESFRLLNGNGDFSVSKFGQTVTRTTNNIVTPSL